MKENMSKKGYVQGDMSPKVEDYNRSMDSYSEAGFSRTTEYIERQDAHQAMNKKDISKQSYKGRYS